MLRTLTLDASKLLAPDPAAVLQVRDAIAAGPWHADAIVLLAGTWREQVIAAVAIASTPAVASTPAADVIDALWTAIDSASWVAPQLVATALLADPAFEPRAADWFAAPLRRPPKTVGALVRAYNRCESRRMSVIAQLHVHDRTMATEEARIGIRGVDGWVDYFAGSSRSS